MVITHNKEEFDRLVEISPPIPRKVMKEFQKKFGSIDNLIKPEVCDELFPTDVFDITEEERENIIQNIVNINKKTERKTMNKKAMEQQKAVESEYRETFFGINGRYPNDFELQRYLDKKNGDVTLDIVDLEEDDELAADVSTV